MRPTTAGKTFYVPNLYRYLVISDDRPARLVRKLYWGFKTFTLPAPRVIVKPMLWTFLGVRSVYYWVFRVFICEPLFKAYCTRYGRGLRTDVFIHWVQGKGDIVIGDNVLIDGKCSFAFSSRYCERPVLEIGDNTGIGPGCSFAVGKRIAIGRHCMLAGGSLFFDSNGHPTDTAARLAHLPPDPEEVRPIDIGDNVWVGMRSTIYPGVKIGEGSIVSANSVVRSNVRPYTVVAGNPARKIADLPRPPESVPRAESTKSSSTEIEARSASYQLSFRGGSGESSNGSTSSNG